jgi:hypothetical protein
LNAVVSGYINSGSAVALEGLALRRLVIEVGGFPGLTHLHISKIVPGIPSPQGLKPLSFLACNVRAKLRPVPLSLFCNFLQQTAGSTVVLNQKSLKMENFAPLMKCIQKTHGPLKYAELAGC